MKSAIKAIFDTLIDLLVERFVLLIASAAASLFSAWGIFLWLPNDYSVDVGTIVLIFLGIYLLLEIVRLKPHKFLFRINSLNIIVEYHGDEVVVREDYEVKCNRFSATQMYTRREWFSDEKYSLKATTDGFGIDETNKIGQRSEFYILFPKRMYFWEKITFSLEFRGSNRTRQFKNFYWYEVICPTKQLSIDTRISLDYCEKYIYLKSFLDHENAPNTKKEIISYNGQYCWNITPKLWHSYKYEWRWSKSELKKICKKDKLVL